MPTYKTGLEDCIVYNESMSTILDFCKGKDIVIKKYTHPSDLLDLLQELKEEKRITKDYRVKTVQDININGLSITNKKSVPLSEVLKTLLQMVVAEELRTKPTPNFRVSPCRHLKNGSQKTPLCDEWGQPIKEMSPFDFDVESGQEYNPPHKPSPAPKSVQDEFLESLKDALGMTLSFSEKIDQDEYIESIEDKQIAEDVKKLMALKASYESESDKAGFLKNLSIREQKLFKEVYGLVAGGKSRKKRRKTKKTRRSK